ncbi:MAG: hypothetical protein Q7T82_16155 [Armatimonadota bacterium]|nr:hypothetical protein [Armatimonadota bacterium]
MRTLRFCSYTPQVLMVVLLLPLTSWSAPVAGAYGGWQAAWSADGKQIAFASGLPHSSSNIWIVNADGSGARQLTRLGGQEPVWSADDREIRFQSNREFGPRYYFVPADGHSEEKLFDRLPAGARAATWSPDGKKIVYTLAEGGKQGTFVVDEATGEVRPLKYQLSAREFCWSPDGQRLAIVTGETIGDSLLQYDLATDKLEHVYHGYCSSPSLSSDGKMLAFATPLGRNRHRLTVVFPSEKKDRKFEISEFDGKSLSWSRDNRTLLFASATSRKPARIWTVKSDGQTPKSFAGSYDWAGHPQYSPSGKFIVFEAVEKSGYSSNLYVCRADGSGAKRLTATGSSYWQPQWSPAGKLVVLTDQGGRGQVLLLDPVRGDKRRIGDLDLRRGGRIAFSPASDRAALVQGGFVRVLDLNPKAPPTKPIINSPYPTTISWSSDGKVIYYSDARMNGLGISSIGVDGKNRRALTPANVTPAADKTASEPVPGGGEEAAAKPNDQSGKSQVEQTATQNPVVDLYPAVCPDDKTVVFVRGSELWTVSTDGADERLLIKPDAGPEDIVSYPSWSRDGRLILFQLHRRSAENLTFELWTVNSDGGDLKLAYQSRIESQFDVYSEESTNPPRFTPDGKSVVLTLARSGRPEICLLDLASGRAKQLTQAGGTFPCVSSDGSQLAYTSVAGGRESINILDVASGKLAPLKLKG